AAAALHGRCRDELWSFEFFRRGSAGGLVARAGVARGGDGDALSWECRRQAAYAIRFLRGVSRAPNLLSSRSKASVESEAGSLKSSEKSEPTEPAIIRAPTRATIQLRISLAVPGAPGGEAFHRAPHRSEPGSRAQQGPSGYGS